MNEDLEEYRQAAVRTLKQNAGFISSTASDVLGVPCKGVYVIGSVLEPGRFSEGSDIDVAVVIEGPEHRTGMDEGKSANLQAEMARYPLSELGVVNTLVFINSVRPTRGKKLRIT
jgi:predicted nucleotidyltransferase